MILPSFGQPALFAAITGLGIVCAAALGAQTVDAGALSPGPDATGSAVSGAAAQLANPGGAARVEMKLLMARLAGKGPVAATVADLSSYGDGTMIDMKAAIDPDADPCVASVQAALFLDAHLVETGWWEKLKSIDRPVEATAEILTIWALPDVYGVTADGLGLLSFRKASPVFQALSIGSNALGSYDVLVEHNIGSVEQRQAIWTQEIVQKSIKYGWDEGVISDRRAYLQGKTIEYVAALTDLDQKTETDMNRVETQFNTDIAKIDRWEADQYDALRVKYNVKTIWPENANTELAAIKNEAVSKGQAARNTRHGKLTALATAYDETATRIMQDIAKAETQQDALVRYARPIARNECESIRKDGALPNAPLLPSSLEAPFDRDAKDAARLGAILALPHEQLMTTLDALGIWPEERFLSCVCRAAGYGSSGTAQYYHPGTIGTYDKRYSCQHPGDPCIVSGFGCMRYPMPSDPKPWESCAAAAKGDAAQTVTDSILSRMAARREKPQK